MKGSQDKKKKKRMWTGDKKGGRDKEDEGRCKQNALHMCMELSKNFDQHKEENAALVYKNILFSIIKRTNSCHLWRNERYDRRKAQ